MINEDKEKAFIDFYVMDREFFLPDHSREALGLIAYLVYNKKLDRALAVDIANTKINKKYELNLEKEYIWKIFRQRQAYFKHAKKAYKQYSIDKRTEIIPNIENKKLKLCECDCGLPVSKPGNRFINGHNNRCRDKEKSNELAEYMREVKYNKLNKVAYLKDWIT